MATSLYPDLDEGRCGMPGKFNSIKIHSGWLYLLVSLNQSEGDEFDAARRNLGFMRSPETPPNPCSVEHAMILVRYLFWTGTLT